MKPQSGTKSDIYNGGGTKSSIWNSRLPTLGKL